MWMDKICIIQCDPTGGSYISNIHYTCIITWSYSCIIQLYDTVISYSCMKQLYNTVVWYIYIIQLYNTGISYRYILQLYDTVIQYSYIIQLYHTVIYVSYTIITGIIVLSYDNSGINRYQTHIVFITRIHLPFDDVFANH